jgi:serine/threonine protein kinase
MFMPDVPEYAINSRQEYQILQKLFLEPGFVKAHDYYTTEDRSWMVMDYLEGQTMTELIL